eukprot:jgi/Bigna1/68448/fgenesh1_pg.6_\
MASAHQIAGLTADEQPSGRWYDLDDCVLMEDGTYKVKVADSAAARKAGMAGASASSVDSRFIRIRPTIKEEKGEENEGGEARQQTNLKKDKNMAGKAAAAGTAGKGAKSRHSSNRNDSTGGHNVEKEELHHHHTKEDEQKGEGRRDGLGSASSRGGNLSALEALMLDESDDDNHAGTTEKVAFSNGR